MPFRVEPIAQALSLNGDGTGATNINGDYSSGNTDFFIQPVPNEDMIINKLTILIRDSDLRSDRYGNLPELPNGMRLTYNSTKIDPTGRARLDGNRAICCNADFRRLPGTFLFLGDTPGSQYATMEIDLRPFGPGGLFLEGDRGDSLVFRARDDLTGLVEHRATAHGIIDRNQISARKAAF